MQRKSTIAYVDSSSEPSRTASDPATWAVQPRDLAANDARATLGRVIGWSTLAGGAALVVGAALGFLSLWFLFMVPALVMIAVRELVYAASLSRYNEKAAGHTYGQPQPVIVRPARRTAQVFRTLTARGEHGSADIVQPLQPGETIGNDDPLLPEFGITLVDLVAFIYLAQQHGLIESDWTFDGLVRLPSGKAITQRLFRQIKMAMRHTEDVNGNPAPLADLVAGRWQLLVKPDEFVRMAQRWQAAQEWDLDD